MRTWAAVREPRLLGRGIPTSSLSAPVLTDGAKVETCEAL
jgi:hypothetical protein